ncbi:uncharacterized protein LOC118274868 [Spodoptera frugiperda]|uniref:Uncharacterized protein LOC118274868 n=1 Tax=Spodoptera frugiperda TaxID=7108 RepID=A0A9R0EQ29_SPOFR|nr:uncharacterized protein LOC118274868 [Spodoptera frugiperda]
MGAGSESPVSDSGGSISSRIKGFFSPKLGARVYQEATNLQPAEPPPPPPMPTEPLKPEFNFIGTLGHAHPRLGSHIKAKSFVSDSRDFSTLKSDTDSQDSDTRLA